MTPDARRLEASLSRISAEYDLPPDLEPSAAVGSRGESWRVDSPSSGDSWLVRLSPPAEDHDRTEPFSHGRKLTSLALRSGLPVASPLELPEATTGHAGEPSLDAVVRPWLPGLHLDPASPAAVPGDLTDSLGALLAGLHGLWPLGRMDEDAVRKRYGLRPLGEWEQGFNQAEDADLAWTALAPDALPAIQEASRLVASGLQIRGLTPVVTHRQVFPRHVIVNGGAVTLIDPFDAGPDFTWLETVDTAVAFGEAVEGLLDATERAGGYAGPAIPEALARPVGRELAELAALMTTSLREAADDEATARLTSGIEESLARLTHRVESVEDTARQVFG